MDIDVLRLDMDGYQVAKAEKGKFLPLLSGGDLFIKYDNL